MPPLKKKQELFRLVTQAGVYTSIPMILVGGPLLGFVIGRFLDRHFSWDPWGVAFGSLAGLLASGIETVRLIQFAQRNSRSS